MVARVMRLRRADSQEVLSYMKYALRTLWNDRGFATMAVLSLAIGIGANTAIFSLVSGVLLRPLAFPDPQRLVAISISTPQFRNGEPLPINLGQLVEWRKRTHSFEGIGAYRLPFRFPGKFL